MLSGFDPHAAGSPPWEDRSGAYEEESSRAVRRPRCVGASHVSAHRSKVVPNVVGQGKPTGHGSCLKIGATRRSRPVGIGPRR